MQNSFEYYKLAISIAAIITALFILFFKTWWDDNEKKNQELEGDIIRLKYLSEQIKSSIHFVEKTIESYNNVINAIKLKDYEVPDRQVIFQVVLENITNIKDVEYHNYIFSKYYQKYYSDKYEDILFTKVTTSYKWMLLFDKDLTRRFEISRQKQSELKGRFINNFYELKNLLVIMIKNPKNKAISEKLNVVFMSQTSVDFNSYDVLFIYKNYIEKAMSVSAGNEENKGFMPDEYKLVFDVFEKTTHVIHQLQDNIINSFSELEFYLNLFNENLTNIKELSHHLDEILVKMEKPIKGDFFVKFQYYMS
ncbi:MAG: hypothetical protein Q8L37_04615, partial [Candidatus Gottesmanbacteria bacterium]|nr:hypothetical protein [Candidatus Gottesmanbacteria bacterium]